MYFQFHRMPRPEDSIFATSVIAIRRIFVVAIAITMIFANNTSAMELLPDNTEAEEIGSSSKNTYEMERASYEFVTLSARLMRIYLAAEKPSEAYIIYDALMKLERFRNTDEIIAEMAFDLVKYYCSAGEFHNAFMAFQYTNELTKTENIRNILDKIKIYLKEAGVEEVPDMGKNF